MSTLIIGDNAQIERTSSALRAVGAKSAALDATGIAAQDLSDALLVAINEHKATRVILSDNLPVLPLCQTLAKQVRPPALILLSDQNHIASELVNAGINAVLPINASTDKIAQILHNVARPNAAASGKKCRSHIAARTHRGLELVHMDQVYYFVSDSKYVRVRHQKGEMLIDDTLKNLEQEFEGVMFRIHRNALIKIDCLDVLEAAEAGQYKVRFKGIDESLYVSRRHLPALRERINCI